MILEHTRSLLKDSALKSKSLGKCSLLLCLLGVHPAERDTCDPPTPEPCWEDLSSDLNSLSTKTGLGEGGEAAEAGALVEAHIAHRHRKSRRHWTTEGAAMCLTNACQDLVLKSLEHWMFWDGPHQQNGVWSHRCAVMATMRTSGVLTSAPNTRDRDSEAVRDAVG